MTNCVNCNKVIEIKKAVINKKTGECFCSKKCRKIDNKKYK